MAILKSFYFLILLIFSSITIAMAADGRDLIIQKEMDCVDEHLQDKGDISWNDVCDVPEPSSQQHMQVVNQQMNQLQGNAAPQISTPDTPIQQKESGWDFEIAPEISSIKYVETNLGSTFIKDKGVMSGVNADITYKPPVGTTLDTEIVDVYRLEAMLLFGKVNYYGGYQNGDGITTPLTFHGINDYLFEIRDLFGKDFDFDKPLTVVRPYMGFGFRSLSDEASAIPNGGYDRLIQYLYCPIGAEITTHLSQGWSIGANVEYDFFIRGFVTSYLGEIGLGNLTNTQDNGGYGLRGSIKITKNFDHFNLYLEPYVRYWNINASRWDSSDPFQGYFIIGQEPSNTSLEIGTKLGIEF